MKKNNLTYTNGMFILSVLCFLGGFSALKLNPYNPYAAGTIFIGLFIGIQYLKANGRTPAHITHFLTWVVVFGFLVVDIILVYYWIKK
ncbi:MAG: hypothetical protein PWR27_2298 [Petroclostridium sp.]|jgi:hypothetical protein|uniref:hypothetical protein n=1 Tax=Petroclostridium xylanilyticum TaxID=1792311 RepID=UPI000B99618C|nr:hypothetical protein [Petroclostridium xylanilyticum]MBZ4647606.1 hypothetical protein [Clostridia bacterium]MDK2811589.1 hypothetical protein [Petroclostridium sp.]